MEFVRSIELDALELRCLSVQHFLKWLVAAEASLHDFLRSAGSARSYYIVPTTHRRLLELCAARFGMQVEGVNDGPELTVTKTAATKMPLLTYYDYIPTPLPISIFNKLFGRCTEVDVHQDIPPPSASDLLLWYYRTLECGFALASHAHLVYVKFTGPEGLTDLQEYAKTRLNIRWVDNKTRTEAILVMRSVAEATELFEMYEDEESGSDSEFRFFLRPVGNAIIAPYIEDTQIRKLRAIHWNAIVQQWLGFGCDGLTIVALNMNEKFTVADLEKSLEGLGIASITIVSEGIRQTRRVAYVTLTDHATVQKALDRDGRNVHGKALRVQMMPPMYDYTRYGTVVQTKVMHQSKTPLLTGIDPTAGPAFNAGAKEYQPQKISPPPSPVVMVSTGPPIPPLSGPLAPKQTPPIKWVPNPNTPPFRPRGPN